MKAPRVSVVVPSYNHERFVGAAVESVLAQSFADLELVVVDDGSTDGSRDVLSGFAHDPRLRLEAQPNRGAHAAIARALELARGEFLFILNSDDRFAPERVARLVAELERHPGASAAASWLDLVDGDDRPIGRKEGWSNLPPWPQPEAGPSLQDLGRPDLALLQTNFVSTTTNLAFRRSAFSPDDLLDLRYCHDWNLALALARRGEIRLVEEPLAVYRVHAGNTLREGRDAALGRGRMRFEILWVVARHARALLGRAADPGLPDGPDAADLARRFARSAPRFGRLDLLAQLLAVADSGDDAMLARLAPDDRFREAAVRALADGD